jgi:diphosphomevalonate decarboxylase
MREGPSFGRAAFVCTASPSLALLKYWGKTARGRNLPATPSLALSLGALRTRTIVEASFEGADEVSVAETKQPGARYADFFDAVRHALRAELRFKARSRNDFPGSSGLASSSSGFAALAHASVRAGEALLEAEPGFRRRSRRSAKDRLTPAEVSALARIGSVSAARAVFGGFCLLPAGSREAKPLFDEDHWPDLRVLVALVSHEEKAVPSREGMERSRSTSVFYRSWVRGAGVELEGAVEAVERRDLEGLGAAMRRSYLRMFGAMLGCDPPLIYWLPASIAIIRECEEMRREGIAVWETMDAGPQVKMLCRAADAPLIADRIRSARAAVSVIESRVGAAPEVEVAPDAPADLVRSPGR